MAETFICPSCLHSNEDHLACSEAVEGESCCSECECTICVPGQ